jgi:two-component system CheB/CheR fusion protein
MVDKYFDHSGTHYTVHRELRRAVIFGRHDLVQDAPISRIDLLVCRNTLMYFHTEAQSRILARFYFSINPGGYILLGRAEMLFSHAAMFSAVDLKRRIFRTVPKPNHRDRLLLLAQTGRDIMANNSSNLARLREAAFESDNIPQVVLDLSGVLAAVNGPARQQFGLSQRDIGRPLQDLEISYRPIELRASIARALEERREIILKDVLWTRESATHYLDITVAPLVDDERSVVGTRVSFHDVTEFKSLQEQLTHSKQELETAYEELQSTNEELETTNEELQSTVEELETTNDRRSSFSTRTIGCRCGTSAPPTCGDCAPTRCRARTFSASTSDFRYRSSATAFVTHSPATGTTRSSCCRRRIGAAGVSIAA